MKFKTVLLLAGLGIFGTGAAEACSLAYHTAQLPGGERYLNGRTLDLSDGLSAFMNNYLEIYPRGQAHDGNTATKSFANPAKWTSKYGSLMADNCGGVNEKGLSVDLLELAYSVYDTPDSTTPCISFQKVVLYLLDNAATVSESLAMLDKVLVANDAIVSSELGAHFAIRDASNDVAMIEFVNGGTKKSPKSLRVVYRGPSFDVMTNEPTMDKQLKYYKKFAAGKRGLGGDFNALDRFVRLKMFKKTLPAASSSWDNVCNVFQLMDSVHTVAGSVDYSRKEFEKVGGKKVPAEMWPNIWTSVLDMDGQVFYLKTAQTPGIIWVDMKKIDFSTTLYGYLNWKDDKTLIGEVNDKFLWVTP